MSVSWKCCERRGRRDECHAKPLFPTLWVNELAQHSKTASAHYISCTMLLWYCPIGGSYRGLIRYLGRTLHDHKIKVDTLMSKINSAKRTKKVRNCHEEYHSKKCCVLEGLSWRVRRPITIIYSVVRLSVTWLIKAWMRGRIEGLIFTHQTCEWWKFEQYLDLLYGTVTASAGGHHGTAW